jgi:tetraacyldisaccharide 4'-kinase
MSVRRPLLLPLVPLYGLGIAIKRSLLKMGWPKQRRLKDAVLSIGSLSAGGAGKTPVVLMLATILRQRGYAVRILTRGYGRDSKAVSRVEPFDEASWHGDEPVLLAQRSNVPVFVGADRYQAGVLAEQNEPTDKTVVHLLDDGFQHRKLARDMDIVLLTREDVEDKLLPAGNLREPLTTLKDADVIVLREEEVAALGNFIAGLRWERPELAIWVIRRRLSLGEGGDVALPTRPFAFCGIARPESFTRMLAGVGYEPVETMLFADHHPYDEHDITKLMERARQCGANGFVTTEKDAVKLTPILRDRLETIGPVVVARLHVELLEEKQVMNTLVSMVGRLDRRHRPGPA